MAVLALLDARGAIQHLQMTGAGTAADPFVLQTNAATEVSVSAAPADPFGSNADAAVAAGAVGSIQAKLRLLTTQLNALQTALESLDDLMESGRGKSNPIVGQAGVAAGAGAVDATTQRVALASDSDMPVPSGSVASSSAYEASRVVKASAGKLIALFGYSSSVTAQFIQLHNTTSVPANGAAPLAVFTVGGAGNFSLDIPTTGLPCSTGITVCNSSTGPTKTLGAADCWFVAVYI